MSKGAFLGLAVCFFVISTNQAIASDGSQSELIAEGLQSLGIKTKVATHAGKCSVVAKMDEDKLMQDIPIFRATGIISANLSNNYYQSHEATTLIVLSLELAAYDTKNILKRNQKLDNCSFSFFMSHADNYGKVRSFRIFSYDFSRALYNKIGWDNFNPVHLPEVANDFRKFPLFSGLMALSSEESQAQN